MPLHPSRLLALLLLSSTAIGQTTPNPASVPTATPGANPAAAPSPGQANPASMPVQPASDAGATERGLSPVQPGNPGVTRRVQNANTHAVDAQGHVLDPHGKPVGQAASPSVMPAPPSTVR
ncbi:hypothetical protein [Luteibacter sp. dw_328]|uniref:hypothetical protein n=1 Tax=Luteibacter sp. dw_328 TaxID=2719796 RepID=UPI001BD2547B|nr:hypothetical protein [Luteibacter sp. dw_328]